MMPAVASANPKMRASWRRGDVESGAREMQVEVARLRVDAADDDRAVVDRQELAGDGIAAIIVGGDGHALARPAPAHIAAAAPLDRIGACRAGDRQRLLGVERRARAVAQFRHALEPGLGDRKSTRLNSSHPSISYAVFCFKKKK